MIRFHFALCPLDEVSPWGGDQRTLHWFGLTAGWYWLEIDGRRLLRRTRVDDPHPYVDYYVARLWEDIYVLTPEVMEPVPADLRSFIGSNSEEWACDLVASADRPEDGSGEDDPDVPDHPSITAATWYGEHHLDLGYLRNAPQLRLWREVDGDSDEITVDWRHEDDGEIGFTAGRAVRLSVPTAAYLEAVRTLDRELMNEMGQRVEELERRGGLPGVDLDLVGLRREHEDRAQCLASSLERAPNTDWAAVRRGARRLLGG